MRFWNQTARLAIMIAAVALLAGCSHWLKPPQDDPRARQILDRLLKINHTLTQYKGLANIQMQMNGTDHRGRIAFAAVQPDKMRVELLNMLGTPLTTLSGDGEMVTVVSYGDSKYYRFRQTRTVLESLIKIPIGIEDLQTILAGRVPLPPYAMAKTPLGSTDRVKDVIVLKNRWYGVVAKLQMDKQAQHIKTLRVIGPEGNLQYQVSWTKWRQVGDYSVPAKLTIESPEKQKLTLTMDRYWPNAAVSPDTFIIENTRGKKQS